MDTMEILAERKQEKKLEIFTRLRNLLIVAVVLATLTLIGFSSVVIFDLSVKIWKYHIAKHYFETVIFGSLYL